MDDAVRGSAPYEAPDISDLPLHDLLALNDTALGNALIRLRHEATHRVPATATFDAAL